MILVTGAAGFIGRHLVRRLLDEGHQVRVILPLRRYRHLPWEASEQLELFDGSIFKPEDIHRAMARVHTVYHLASAQWWGGTHELEFVDVAGTRAIVTAGRSARIGRIITLSHIGAEPASGFSLLRAKGQVEEVIRKSGIAFTIFRSGVIFGSEDRFVNNIAMLLKTNPFFVFQPGQAENLLHPLHIDDLTQGLVNSLEVLDLVDMTVEIGGAEYMTYNEMLRTVMRVTNTSRTIMSPPAYLLRTLSRNIRRLSPRFPVTPQWFDILAGHRTADIRNLYNYTGVSARRFEDTILTYMPQRSYNWELLRFSLRRRPRAWF